MPAQQRPPELLSAQDMLRSLRDPGRNLKDHYKDHPLELAKRLGLRLPEKPVTVMQRLGVYDPEKHGPIVPGIREWIEDVCLGRVESAVVVGPRGGGKSQGVSFIEFYLWAILNYDALNLGGSELQADQVYQYLIAYIEKDPYWQSLVRGDTMQSKTTSTDGAWIRVLTASQKSVRSPHAGGPNQGGLLVIDEEAETERDIVESALPTINTANPSVNVRCSTFHNAEGTFADLVDNHESMGYQMYRWDVFDVCKRCECVDKCESAEPCFREDHYESYVNPDTGQVDRRLLHRAYCGGRTRYADGWVSVREIEKMWRRWNRNHGRFEVEAMGSRPSSAGFVVKDLNAFAQNITTESAADVYEPGFPVWVCVDWGTQHAGVSVWQEQRGGRHVQIHSQQLEDTSETHVVSTVVSLASTYSADLVEVAADIGGGGSFLNPKLEHEYQLPVRGVNFAEEKEAAVAAWNIINESGKCVYPAEHEVFIHQVRNWKRKNGRIKKGNDHLCDSTICYFSRFIDLFGLRSVRVLPRAVDASGQAAAAERLDHAKYEAQDNRGRVPVAVAIGGTRRRGWK